MSELPEPSGPTYRICFVCSGNICRSPTAEVVMRRLLEDAGLADAVKVDSAGTGAWHVGNAADARAARTMLAKGYDGSRHRARVFEPAWLGDRDLIVALDGGHLRELQAMAATDQQRDAIRLLRSFDPTAPKNADVPDPYYGTDREYLEAFEQIERACRGLLDQVAKVLRRDRV